jgi:DNA-binding transcriptional ArsR family regulator
MPSRRFKLEFYDPDGVKHSLTVDGAVTREKVSKLLDLVEMISGNPMPTANALRVSPRKYDRLASTVLTDLKTKPDFTSNDAKKAYETGFQEKILLSTVSTYLTRLADKGILERVVDGQSVRYRIVMPETRSRPSLQTVVASGLLQNSSQSE